MKGVPLAFPGIVNTLPVVRFSPHLPKLLDGFQMREVKGGRRGGVKRKVSGTTALLLRSSAITPSLYGA